MNIGLKRLIFMLISGFHVSRAAISLLVDLSFGLTGLFRRFVDADRYGGRLPMQVRFGLR